MLACFAYKGWQVVGVDVLQDSVDKINGGTSPIYEPGVDDLIKLSKKFITATTDPVQATKDTSVSFIIVPTPSIKDGSFSLDYVEKAASQIGMALKEKDSYHLVVVTSTVMPGHTGRIVKVLEANSGKKCGKDFGVCYNPDFIALGSVVHDFLNPDMVLIGESDEKAGRTLEAIHKKLVNNVPEIHRMSLRNAELAKIGLNAFLTMKITYANIIGEICENMPTGDAEKVLGAIGADKRVGKKYLRAGLAFSGPCFPRDCKAFKIAASDCGVSHVFSVLTDLINNYHKKTRIAHQLTVLGDNSPISVLGLTYKENVTLIDESVPIEIIKELSKMEIPIRVYDPAGMPAAKKELSGCSNVVFTESVQDCLKGTQICFIATAWDEFKKLTIKDFSDNMKDDPIIFDAWGIYKGTDIEKFLDYYRVGRNEKTV
jgi:UDPglucose 6-dehydrogenase